MQIYAHSLGQRFKIARKTKGAIKQVASDTKAIPENTTGGIAQSPSSRAC